MKTIKNLEKIKSGSHITIGKEVWLKQEVGGDNDIWRRQDDAKLELYDTDLNTSDDLALMIKNNKGKYTVDERISSSN